MSDKLLLKGNITVSDPDIQNWLEFANRVLRVTKNNQHHSIDAVCELKSYAESEILESHKISAKMIDWITFAPKALEFQNRYHDFSISCSVTLRAAKKGKAAGRAIDNNQLALFATTRAESIFDAAKIKEAALMEYTTILNESIHKLAGHNGEEEENPNLDSDVELEAPIGVLK